MGWWELTRRWNKKNKLVTQYQNKIPPEGTCTVFGFLIFGKCGPVQQVDAAAIHVGADRCPIPHSMFWIKGLAFEPEDIRSVDQNPIVLYRLGAVSTTSSPIELTGPGKITYHQIRYVRDSVASSILHGSSNPLVLKSGHYLQLHKRAFLLVIQLCTYDQLWVSTPLWPAHPAGRWTFSDQRFKLGCN